VSAIDASRVLEIPESVFRTEVLSSPESLLAMLRTLSARMRNDLHSLASDNQQITEYAAEVERVNRELSAIKISLEEKNRQLEHISSIDTLTGLANRRHFDDILRQEWRRASRDNAALSVAYCDIDFFKAFNDAYGHLSGDDCLRRVARSLGESVSRPADLAARYGGEEFVVLLVDTGLEGAAFLGEKMRKRVEELRIPHPRSPIARFVTVSLGIATMVPRAGSRPEDLVGRADAALYRAKEQGRNRVQLAEDDSEPANPPVTSNGKA
jgi:diguanylate cyclase (GGDEF)-like protein